MDQLINVGTLLLPAEPAPVREPTASDPETDAVAQVSLPVGMKVDDRYEIEGILGTGGFATVYRAHHLTIDRDVALKVMDLKKGVDPSYSERFFREAKIAAKIHHNNVVSIYDFGHVAETKQPYIAMEMLHGRDLSHELEEIGPLSPKRMYVLFRPVLDALAEGHRLGIVHKDLKPENLYLVDPGGPRELMKILDFGVARVNSSEVSKLTTAGQLLGTPRYLAPEYIKSQSVSPAIDVYQMALIISEALTGIPAVTGDPFHAMMLHCSGKLQISSFLLEGPVGDVFRRAISIDPEQRYPDCGAFGEALDSIEPYFESNVPLQGGAPQIIPGNSFSGRISGPYSGSQVTGSLDAIDSSITAAPYNTVNKKKLAVISIVFIAIAVLFAVVAAIVTNSKKQNDAFQSQIKNLTAEVSYHFQFKSSPEGASVRIKGEDFDLCQTPCEDDSLKSHPGELAEWVTISKEGYEIKEVQLTSEMYETSGGLVNVELTPIPDEYKILPFKFVYIPVNAKVTVIENGDEIVVCKRSPCSYNFNTSKKVVTVTFSAPGREPQNVLLSEKKHASNSTINVALKEIPKTKPRPAARTKPSNTNTDSKPKQDPPKKKEDPAPVIRLI